MLRPLPNSPSLALPHVLHLPTPGNDRVLLSWLGRATCEFNCNSQLARPVRPSPIECGAPMTAIDRSFSRMRDGRDDRLRRSAAGG